MNFDYSDTVMSHYCVTVIWLPDISVLVGVSYRLIC